MGRKRIRYAGVGALNPNGGLDISISVQFRVYRHRLCLRQGNFDLLCHSNFHRTLCQLAIEVDSRSSSIHGSLSTRI